MTWGTALVSIRFGIHSLAKVIFHVANLCVVFDITNRSPQRYRVTNLIYIFYIDAATALIFFRCTSVRISSTFSVLPSFSYLRHFLYFDPPTLLRPKLYFDQNLTSTKKIYFDLYFSTNKKYRFDKWSKYASRSKEVEVEGSKYRKGRTDAHPCTKARSKKN